MTKTKLFIRTAIFGLLLSKATISYSQEEGSGTYLELSAGMKTALADLTYSKGSWPNTAEGGLAVQPSLRADLHLVLFYIRDQEFAIDLMGQTGIMQYFNARNFEYTNPDNPQEPLIKKSKNPTYLPLYLGFYTPGFVSFGFEGFYYKGVGVADLYGFKALSLGFNARKFRVGAALEMYGLVNSKTHVSRETFLSFEFLWKLKRRDE